MKTKQHGTELDEKVRPTTLESVKFRDGMVVTADDLDTAMRYPASLLHTVLRSYFGCGVVCGLGLRVKEPLGTKDRPNWVVCVDRGVAIDCHGYPIELCAPVELDLSPEACGCDPVPEHVCIAVRRITSDEAPKDACSCDVDAPQFACRRTRDWVVVRAFTKAELDALPSVCRRPKVKPKSGAAKPSEQPWSEAMCGSLTGCPECTCGECWVLLGCLTLKKDEGITKEPDTKYRRWVKPNEVLCTSVADQINKLEEQLKPIDPKLTVAKRIGELEKKVQGSSILEERMKLLEEKVASLTPAAPPPGGATGP